MRSQVGVIVAVLAILGAAPVHASDEKTAADRPFSVHLAVGSHLSEGGHLQSLSLGYDASGGVSLLVNVERNHVPTRLRSFSATRGGTLTSLSGELRYTVPVGGRVSPFVVAGLGAGISRPNVNDHFSNAVSNTARFAYAGGGVRVRLRPRLDWFIDGRFQLMAERDVLAGRLPIRAGLTWRF